MQEEIFLLLILLFIIIVLSKLVVRLMKSDHKKYRIPILYGRILLGFLLAMLLYIVYLMLKGEDVINKLVG
jgi:L-asparagine transporter-like permease